MHRLRLVGLLVTFAFAAGPTCGQDVERKREGEPCTRTGECAEWLTCMGGTCERPDDAGGGDSGASDAGSG